MTWPLVLAHILLPSAIAVASGWGAWRCWRLLRLAADPRLVKLTWFYGLFAASLVALTIWTGQVAWAAGDALGDATPGSFTEAFGLLHGAFVSAERVNIFLLAHHALMLASLGVAVLAFSPRPPVIPAVAMGGLALVGALLPGVLALEAALALYLAVRAILNHRARRNANALRVAAGFLLFFLGHLSFFLFYRPGAARNPLGDIFALAGIVILVRLLPRPSA